MSQVRGGAVKKPGGFQPDLVRRQLKKLNPYLNISLGLPDALGERRGPVGNLLSHGQRQLRLACLWQRLRPRHR